MTAEPERFCCIIRVGCLLKFPLSLSGGRGRGLMLAGTPRTQLDVSDSNNSFGQVVARRSLIKGGNGDGTLRITAFPDLGRPDHHSTASRCC